ncbi:radical SAM protein [Streptomyces sp. NPDC058548]|uniref:radical SAM protein n=1 Tax=Streptomyces sp. NPDC058548 TaxID=3346545 RepID=UPI003661920A
MSALSAIQSVELEITGTCQLKCTHCCTDSGPDTPAGKMTREDWLRVIDDVAELGIPAVQLIGGEPTLSPHLTEYIDHALARGRRVEVYSNLSHIRPAVWSALARPGVCLATSYYSDTATEHEEITRSRGSFGRTRRNIITALDKGIDLRVGIVEVLEGQRVDEAAAELRALGIERIQIDRVRKVGRALDEPKATAKTSELCGHCFRHRVSVSPDGAVSGCILSRFMVAGNVRERRLADILTSDRYAELTHSVPLPSPARGGCPPDDSSDCSPANTEACDPAYYAPPTTPAFLTLGGTRS